MKVTVFDYGAGNLHSLCKALVVPEWVVSVESDPIEAVETDFLILPGVGAFQAAAECLAPGLGRMKEAIDRGLPVLGICLGMQLLFGSSEEGAGEGLNIFAGSVTKIHADRVPHMGWNELEWVSDLWPQVPRLSFAYYANSFVCRPDDTACVAAWSSQDHDRFPAVVFKKNVVGIQGHPEKSSAPGLEFVHGLLRTVASRPSRYVK